MAVTGNDVLLAARPVRADEPVWVDGVRCPATDALARAAAAVADVHARV